MVEFADEFYNWFFTLAEDASRKGCLARFAKSSDIRVWRHIYDHGVPPTVLEVLAWAVADPSRWAALHETEVLADAA